MSDTGLWRSIVEDIVIPEVAAFIRSRRANGEPDPTDDEIKAKLALNARSLIDEGKAFLASKQAQEDDGA